MLLSVYFVIATIIGVLSQSNVTNSTLHRILKEIGCQNCPIERSGGLPRMEQIKRNILKKLSMKTILAIPKKPIPDLPHLKEAINNANMAVQRGSSARSTTSKMYLFSKRTLDSKPDSATITFDLTNVNVSSYPNSLVKAILCIYVRNNSPTPFKTFSTLIYDVSTNEILHRKEIVQADLGSWLNFDVTNSIKKWENVRTSNVGFKVVVSDSKSMQMLLVNAKQTSEESYLPALDITLNRVQSSRSKRSASDTTRCSESSRGLCCKSDLLVNFTDLGWNFIIAPSHYIDSFCHGRCPSHVFKYPIANAPTVNYPEHCCGAQEYSPLSFVYYNENNDITVSLLHNMVVERCDCPLL